METDDRLDRWQRNCHATLENGAVIVCHNKTAWIEWMKTAHASGSHIVVESDVEGFRISTVFMGINLNLSGFGPALWFQTMVYRGSIDGTLGTQIRCGTLRYSTFADALIGHFVVHEEVRSGDIGE